MLVTVLWEDQRGTQARGFGPHELLLSCLADELMVSRECRGRLPRYGLQCSCEQTHA